MNIDEMKDYELIFKAYQRMLLRELEYIQEAVRTGDRESADQQLTALIEDTRASLDD